MTNELLIDFYKSELRNGVILNPFWLIDGFVQNNTEVYDRKVQRKYSKIASACEEAAELFLNCTDYTVDSPSNDNRNCLSALLTALYICMTTDFPADKRNAFGLIKFLQFAYKGDNGKSILSIERYFDKLRKRMRANPAIKHFDAFCRYPGSRQDIETMLLRFRPLLSVACCDRNLSIFKHCTESELYALSVSMIHNSSPYTQDPAVLKEKKTEITLIFAILSYLMHVCKNEYQTSCILSRYLNLPGFFDTELKMALSNQSISEKLHEVNEYWNICSEEILRGNYDKELIKSVYRNLC